MDLFQVTLKPGVNQKCYLLRWSWNAHRTSADSFLIWEGKGQITDRIKKIITDSYL